MAKAAIQTLSELNPLAALDAKVSDEQEAEFTKLRLVPDTRPSAIYDQARPTFDNPGARSNWKAEQNDITGRHIGSPVGRDRSSIAILHVGAKNRHVPTVPRQVRVTKTSAPDKGREGTNDTTDLLTRIIHEAGFTWRMPVFIDPEPSLVCVSSAPGFSCRTEEWPGA